LLLLLLLLLLPPLPPHPNFLRKREWEKLWRQNR
jgi:hypothetical protein